MSFGWAAHEIGHAIHWIARHPGDVPYVDVHRVGNEARVEPHITCDLSELGMTPLINFAAGSLGERVHAGEINAIERLIDETDNWVQAIFDTPHYSDHDWQSFKTIIVNTPGFPVKEFAEELVTAEQLIQKYLPYVDVAAFQRKLERDGHFRFEVYDLKKTLH